MNTITVVVDALFDRSYAENGCESQQVSFTTSTHLNVRWLETAVMQLHEDLVNFEYSPQSGKGSFSLLDTGAELGSYTMRYPALRTVTQRTVYHFQGLIRDETHTHIATGVHGFESLCCSEMLADRIEKTDMPENGKVTCPQCKMIWQDCRAFEFGDFTDK